MTAEEDAYKRGQQDATVAEHSRHLERINGTLETVSHQLADIALARLRVSEQAARRDAVAVHTAQTAKDTRQAAIDKTAESWKPWQKLSVGIITIEALAGAV